MGWPKGKPRGSSPNKGRKLGPRKLPADVIDVLHFYASGEVDGGESARAVLEAFGALFETPDPDQQEIEYPENGPADIKQPPQL